MFEDLWEQQHNHSRKVFIKICPVCKAVFHIPEEMKILEVYCLECDTDYFFTQQDPIPFKCNNRPTRHQDKKTRCGCGRCGK